MEKLVIPILAGVDYALAPRTTQGRNAVDASSRPEVEQLIQEMATTLNLQRKAAGKATDDISSFN